MTSHIKKLDMFGVSFTFNTFGQSKFKTACGGYLTIITLFIVGISIYLFGTDFFHKENPNVTPNQMVQLDSKKVKVPNESFSFMFRLQDGLSKPHDVDKTPYRLDGTYFHLKKSDAGEYELKCSAVGNNIITKCSNTKATLNRHLTKERLEEWYCWDMERIKSLCKEQGNIKDPDYEPFIGGNTDEDEYAMLRFEVKNWAYDYEKKTTTFLSSFEELEKFGGPMLNIRYPNVSYDSSLRGDPLEVYYDSQLVKLVPTTWRRDFRLMSIVTAIDDNGWMLPMRTTTTSLEPQKVDTEYLPSKWSGELKYFYMGFFMNVKRETIYKRNFMKIQSLVAIVGGMMKSVVATFGFFGIINAIRERDESLRDEFYKVKVRKNAIIAENPLTIEDSNIKKVVAQNVNEAASLKLGFWAFLFRFFCKSAERSRQVRLFEQMNEYMYKKMDVAYLFKMFEQFENMKDMLLSEEQKELLKNNKTEIELEV